MTGALAEVFAPKVWNAPTTYMWSRFHVCNTALVSSPEAPMNKSGVLRWWRCIGGRTNRCRNWRSDINVPKSVLIILAYGGNTD